jgi:hypothetical protein
VNIAICQFMQWSWGDLLETPPEVVDEILAVMNEEAERREMER